METMSVSRTVIREAISRLQAAKVIETRHGIGSFVLEPSKQSIGLEVVPGTTLRDVLAILELRISLETECAGLAAQRAKSADIARIRAALDMIAAKRALIPRERVDSASIAREDPSAYLSLVNREHESIFDAIARRDAESARAAMRMHLSNSRERLRRANQHAATQFD